MGKFLNIGCGIVVLFMAVACSTADTTGSSTDREYDLTITNHGSGNISIYAPATITAQTDQGTDQTTDNDPANDVSPSTALGLNGSTPSLASQGANLTLEGIKSAWEQMLKTDTTTTTKTSNGTTTPTVIPAPAPNEPPVTKDNDAQSSVYNSKEVKDLQAVEGRSFNWLAKTGKDYGEEVKVSFDNGCAGFVVKNPSISQGADGTKNNHNQPYWFCGTDPELRPGERLPDGNASVFSAPGCVATTVTLEYNKKETGQETAKSNQETIELTPFSGKSIGWFSKQRLGKGRVIFKDRDCGSFDIPDLSKSHGFYGTENFNQNYYFNGTSSNWPYERKGNLPAVVTRIGCLAKTATLEYN